MEGEDEGGEDDMTDEQAMQEAEKMFKGLLGTLGGGMPGDNNGGNADQAADPFYEDIKKMFGGLPK